MLNKLDTEGHLRGYYNQHVVSRFNGRTIELQRGSYSAAKREEQSKVLRKLCYQRNGRGFSDRLALNALLQ